MSFQTTADLEPLSNYSRRAEGWGRGIVIGQTKDDITGMILAMYWKWSAGCMASRGVVARWPRDTFRRLIDMRDCIPHVYILYT